MVSFKIALSSLAAMAVMITPTLSCVDFSLQWLANDDFDMTVVDAGLTDNDVQVCSMVNVPMDYPPTGTIDLSCWDGYSASLDLGSQMLNFTYETFTGTVHTDRKYTFDKRRSVRRGVVQRGKGNPDGPGLELYWNVVFTVRTWGCS